MKTPQEKLEEFFKHNTSFSYKKNSTILRPDDDLKDAYYLLHGYVKDSAVSIDGQEFVLFIFKPEDIFPYNFVFNDLANEHSFVALTPCVVLKCSKSEFLAFLHANPDVLFMLTKKILGRLRGVLQRLEYMAFGNAHKKVASIFIILGERFGEKTKNSIKIALPISHKGIAELVGITRETASVEIKKLEDRKIIKREARFYTILKRQALLKESYLYS